MSNFQAERDEFKKVVGRIVKNYRKKRGWTLRRFAKKSGYSPAFLSQIENNHTMPNMFTIYKIAKTLKIPPELFFQDEIKEGSMEELENNDLQEYINFAKVAYVDNVPINFLDQLIDLYETTKK